MARLLMIRHGPTRWNQRGWLQGRADIGLAPAGRAEVERWRVPAGWAGARWLTSPLTRARVTAAILHDGPVAVDARLIEMDWGAWEGRRLVDLRAADPVAMAANEAEGLDFRPEGGESPREVVARLRSLVLALDGDPGAVVAVCHKGVMRAALALATGWDMRDKPPVKFGRGDGLDLERRPGGELGFDRPLVSLAEM